MAFDGVTVHAICQELNETLRGARITKIYQPNRFDLVFHCRRPGGGDQLLISGHPQYARIHLTEASMENPPNPPAFCMLLRKHLEGGKIVSIRQDGFERIVHVEVENLDEGGSVARKRLVIEIMGRHSNVILLDSDHETILDAVSRITNEVSRYRQVLPGETYLNPPAQDKLNPLATTKEQFITRVSPANPEQKLFEVLMDNYLGISPTTAKEIVTRVGLSPNARRKETESLERIWEEFSGFFTSVTTDSTVGYVAVDGNREPVEFAPYPLRTKGEASAEFASLSRAIDYYYQFKVQGHEVKQMAGELSRIIATNLGRLESKIEKQESTISEGMEAEKYKIAGELLTANLYRVSQGQESITVENFYSEGLEPMDIELDPHSTPAENAQAYFKQYTKAKNSVAVTQKQLSSSQEEKAYLEDVLTAVDLAESVAELEEIKDELTTEGYIQAKRSKKQSKQKKQAPASPLKFQSTDGMTILVGRNNHQNDHLTFRIAGPSDLWLHVKEIPGSHVIIQSGGGQIPDQTLEEAANLAAYYSKGRQSSNVAVDLAPRKNVRKPNGAKPGRVIYEHYRTVYVTPDPDLPLQLRK